MQKLVVQVSFPYLLPKPIKLWSLVSTKTKSINMHVSTQLTGGDNYFLISAYFRIVRITVADAESKLGRCLEVACDDIYLEMTIFT